MSICLFFLRSIIGDGGFDAAVAALRGGAMARGEVISIPGGDGSRA